MKKWFLLGLVLLVGAGIAVASTLNDQLDSSKLDQGINSTEAVATAFSNAATDLVALETVVNSGALAITSLTSSGTVETVQIFGQNLTRSGSDLYWAGNKLTN